MPNRAYTRPSGTGRAVTLPDLAIVDARALGAVFIGHANAVCGADDLVSLGPGCAAHSIADTVDRD